MKERVAIDRLYRTHRPSVLRRARTLLRDPAAAEDAVQEIFVRVLQSSDEFRGDASPATWLHRVTTNHCLNVVRDRMRRRDLLAQKWRPDGSVSGAMEERLAMRRTLAAVPDELRTVAMDYFVDDCSQDEIARTLQVSRRTVGNRLSRFRTLAQASLS